MTRGAGTPLWVWAIDGLGLLAATVLAGSALFSLGAALASDVEVGYDVSTPALLVWSGLVVLAAATWLRRRRRARR